MTDSRPQDFAPEPNASLVTVLETSDAALIPLVESIFHDVEIPFVTRGENIQDLFAAGRIGGVNIAVGPVAFLVRDTDAEDARALLQELQKPLPDGEARQS